MTYRGIVSNGMVVIDGDKPREGTVVEVTPYEPAVPASSGLANHPALGLWKDRGDLPEDGVQASRVLRQKLMRRSDK